MSGHMRQRNTKATEALRPQKDASLTRWCKQNSTIERLVKLMPLCDEHDEAHFKSVVKGCLESDGPNALSDMHDDKGRTLLWHATRELDDKAVRILLSHGNMNETVALARTSSKVDPVALAIELGREDLADIMKTSANAMNVRTRGSRPPASHSFLPSFLGSARKGTTRPSSQV